MKNNFVVVNHLGLTGSLCDYCINRDNNSEGFYCNILDKGVFYSFHKVSCHCYSPDGKSSCLGCGYWFRDIDAPEGCEDCHWVPSEEEEVRPCDN